MNDTAAKKKVLMFGGRDWTDGGKVIDVLLTFEPTTTIIIHGAARGADNMVDVAASEMGFEVKTYPYALFGHLGRAGGPARNAFMLKDNPDIVEAHGFSNHIETSNGSRGMRDLCVKADIPVTIHTSDK